MKSIILFLCLISIFCSAQEVSKKNERFFKKYYNKRAKDFISDYNYFRKTGNIKVSCITSSSVTLITQQVMDCKALIERNKRFFSTLTKINKFKTTVEDITIINNTAIVFYKQFFDKNFLGSDKIEHNVITDGTLHKEWFIHANGVWKSIKEEEIRLGITKMDGKIIKY